MRKLIICLYVKLVENEKKTHYIYLNILFSFAYLADVKESSIRLVKLKGSKFKRSSSRFNLSDCVLA